MAHPAAGRSQAAPRPPLAARSPAGSRAHAAAVFPEGARRCPLPAARVEPTPRCQPPGFPPGPRLQAGIRILSRTERSGRARGGAPEPGPGPLFPPSPGPAASGPRCSHRPRTGSPGAGGSHSPLKSSIRQKSGSQAQS